MQGELCAKVSHFCDWKTRAWLASLTRWSVASFAAQGAHWEWMCQRLSAESLLFCPPTLGSTSNWRQLFVELFPLRSIFDAEASDGALSPSKDLLARLDRQLEGGEALTEEEEAASSALLAKRLKVQERKPQTFEVKVCARIKPAPVEPEQVDKSQGAGPKNLDMGVSVVLPLHQRLQLIRSERKCSLKEARRILWQGSGPSDPWADSDVKAITPPGEADENTPANQQLGGEGDSGMAGTKEDDKVQACVVAVTAGLQGAILMCCPGTGLREFNFDAVLGEDSTQNEVYESAPRRMVVDFINGKNASIFAFGQTGSGKTHT